MNKKENQKIESIIPPIAQTIQMLYFRKYYWGKRNQIFNELYHLLLGNYNINSKSENKTIDDDDDFSDIKSLDENIFNSIFNDDNVDTNINKENKNYNISNDENEEESSEEEYSNDNDNDNDNLLLEENELIQTTNFVPSSKFLRKNKKIIYNNYKKNYEGKKKIIITDDLTLRVDQNKDAFLQIKNVDIFVINYLVKLKLNGKEEWICNPYYGLYLLYYVKKYIKPYPLFLNTTKTEYIIQKTINNNDYLDLLIANDIFEIENKIYNIDLNEIINDTKFHISIELMKNKSRYIKYLNIKNNNSNNFEDFRFLSNIYDNNNNIESFYYTFGNKNNLNHQNLIALLNRNYFENNRRYFYLDFNYIEQIKTNKELKTYFAYWLIKAFQNINYKDYKDSYEKLEPLINKDNIVNVIINLIDINDNLYNTGNKVNYLYIFINNVNKRLYHSMINELKEKLRLTNKKFKFILLCDIDEEINSNLFFEIYQQNHNGLFYLQNDTKGENIDIYNIKKLFSNKNKNIEYFCDLVKIFNINYFLKYKKEKENPEDILFLKKYMKYINLICKYKNNSKKLKIKNIVFKNDEIKNEFLKQYSNYSTYFFNNDQYINEILDNNTDGDFFERAIILDILTEKILTKTNNQLNFKIIEVKSLYALTLNKSFNFEEYKNKNIIFFQKSKTSEVFDFGFLINGNNEKYFKLYQISLNKTKEDFVKLNKNIIKLHCSNIKQKLNKLGEINNFSFGIITSLRVYENSKNEKNISGYKLMEKVCQENKYELLIYDVSKRKLYKEEKNKKYEFNLYTINKDYKLNLPDYSNFYKYNPIFMSFKYINKDYVKNINEYLDKKDAQIIGKIKFEKKFITSKIEDKGLALLISGEIKLKNNNPSKSDKINNKTNDNNKDIINYKEEEDLVYNSSEKKQVIIFKTKNFSKIYEKQIDNEKISEINENEYEKNITLENGHIILIKLNNDNNCAKNQFITKKRNPEKLFSEKIIKKKKNNI
jgi:hypothetical protein